MPRSFIRFSTTLEWILAAWRSGNTIEQFADLDGDDQARIVAAYKTEQQIEAVVAWANRPKPAKK